MVGEKGDPDKEYERTDICYNYFVSLQRIYCCVNLPGFLGPWGVLICALVLTCIYLCTCFYIFIEFIEVRLVNKIEWVSGAQLCNASSCIVCSPP